MQITGRAKNYVSLNNLWQKGDMFLIYTHIYIPYRNIATCSAPFGRTNMSCVCCGLYTVYDGRTSERKKKSRQLAAHGCQFVLHVVLGNVGGILCAV